MKITHVQKPELSSLATDIVNLYASVKHSGLEDLFIKLANIEVDSFANWLFKSKTIKSQLKNISVYDAMDILCQFRLMHPYGSNLDKGAIFKKLYENNKTLKAAEIIVGMKNLYNDASAKDIVLPFRDIIDLVASQLTPSMPPNIPELLLDVNEIRNSFLKADLGEDEPTYTKKPNVVQQKKNMFQYLFVKFTEEIATVFEAAGFADIAEDVKNGALAKASSQKLSEYIQFGRPNQGENITAAKKMVDMVLKQYDSRWENYNHDLVDMFFMGRVGMLSKEQVTNLLVKYEEDKNVFDMLEDDAKYPGIDISGLVTSDKRLNPDYLLMLVAFFVMMQKQIGMPTGLGI